MVEKVNRRHFLRGLAASTATCVLAPSTALARFALNHPAPQPGLCDDQIKDYLFKMENFDSPHPGDVVLSSGRFELLDELVRRLYRLQRVVGHGNFHLLDFDEAIRTADSYPKVGGFTRPELDFMDELFHEDAARYGFYGEKPLSRMTDAIPKRKVVWMDGTGNFLYRGDPQHKYRELVKAVGEMAVLTSGVRSVMKQFLLFLSKARAGDGNLSLASRSLAPPGYSFHGIGDFDVGQKGYGVDNFTDRFTSTEVFARLRELGYVTLRYPRGNLLGVRFEPWHIKVVARA